MPSGPFSKQAIFKGPTPYLNGNYAGDTEIGGALTTAPSGLVASQGWQTLPGDRILLSPSDALAASNNNNLGLGNGALWSGSYRYVASLNNSSAAIARGHGVFWNDATGANNSNLDALYQVNADEAANFNVTQFAGVCINNFTKGNYWWIQESGKATCSFRNAITGTPAIGGGCYLAAGNNNNNAIDVGAFDQLAAANSATIFTANSTTGYTTVDNMIIRYVGPALTLPANNNLALVAIPLNRASFRF